MVSFSHHFHSKFSCCPSVILSCHWNMIWFLGVSLPFLPSSTLHSNWIRIKAARLLTPITMQKLYGIDWKRMMCLSWPRDATLQGKVRNKVSVAASSCFPFPRFKNTDAINTPAQVFVVEFCWITEPDSNSFLLHPGISFLQTGTSTH